MRVEGFVVVNFFIHPKEEERCSTEEEGKKRGVVTFSCFSRWKGMTTNTWGHFLICSLSTQTGHIIHRGLYSMGKSRPPMGISPFLKTVVLYLSVWLCNLYHTVFMEEWFLTLPNAETFFHFLISKQRLRCSRLRGNRMRWGCRKCIVGQRWDYGLGIQKMCWPQMVLLMRASARVLLSPTFFLIPRSRIIVWMMMQFLKLCSPFLVYFGANNFGFIAEKDDKWERNEREDATRLKRLTSIMSSWENATDSCW